MSRRIILASQSPRRKELLSMIGIDFEVEVSSYEEDMSLDMSTEGLAKYLSLNKAKDVLQNHSNEDCIIIGADTFVKIEDEILGKPKDKEDAKTMLRKLSGKTHEVICGLAVIDSLSKKEIVVSTLSKVKFRSIYESEIESYVESGESLDKAGAYAIQGKAAVFVEEISGDYYSIMGLPISKLSEILTELEINIF